MSVNTAPLVDSRSADVVAGQLRDLLVTYAKYQPAGDPLGSALVGIAARFAELIIHRLNQVPDKQFLAFLDLLGASRLPPQTARAPLTFSLATGSVVPGVVPAGTQAAAAPVEGVDRPITFETEREFVVVPARLTGVFVRDPGTDSYSDLSGISPDAASPAAPVTALLDHVLYVGFDERAGRPGVTSAWIDVAVSSGGQTGLGLQWEYWTADGWTKVTPATDTTAELSRAGQVDLGKLSPMPAHAIDVGGGFSVASRWARCRCTKPLHAAGARMQIQTHLTLGRDLMVPDAAFVNGVALDVSKSFFPFGQSPALGDAFYIRCDEAFSLPGATITLHVTVGQAGVSDAAAPVTLTWEVATQDGWVTVGTAKKDSTTGTGFTDSTAALSKAAAAAADVSFKCPAGTAPVAVNGVTGFWARVRISDGGYGSPAKYVKPNPDKTDVVLQPSTLAPPMVSAFSIKYQLTESAGAPDAIVTCNDFRYELIPPGTFQAFKVTTDAIPTLYFGCELPPALRSFPNRPVSLFLSPSATPYRIGDVPIPPVPVRLAWEYAVASPDATRRWGSLSVRDDSASLLRPGVVEFIAPSDFVPTSDFGAMRYWIRVRSITDWYRDAPMPACAALNTTMAAQTTTLTSEMLGSSDGSKKQRFQAVRSPILPGQWLDIREPELPPASERSGLVMVDGAAEALSDRAPTDVWVRWQEVSDFYASGPRDRHYVVDRLAGTILFGDGENGLVPPAGISNVRLARYQTGGGAVGNQPAGSIVQLKTTVPYVARVTNPEAAAGGADAEPIESVSVRVPRQLRHGGRAVTMEDYADLAFEASPDVARAICVPLVNVSGPPPHPPDPPIESAGDVSVIIVPRSDETKPVPSLELIWRVKDYLDARRTPTARLTVAGPVYLRVDVTAVIAPVSLDIAAAVLADVTEAVVSFLHPLTGGFDGGGWDFGREPHPSDLYAVIEAVAGVDYVSSLTIAEVLDPSVTWNVDDVRASGRFMVYAGTPAITLVDGKS